MKLPLPIMLALPLLGAPVSPLLAQEDAEEPSFYRVEAIVFTHAGGRSDAWPVEEAADHSAALDPQWRSFAREQELDRAKDERDSTRSELETALSVVDTIASLESGEETLTEALIYPEPWLALDELSEPMSRARTRLEQSGAFQVRAWQAWHQPLDQDTRSRAVRIHDDRLIAIDWITLSPTGSLLRDGRVVRTVEDVTPAFHFRLDGSVRLRQRQFMHADVLLDWRIPLVPGVSPWPITPTERELEVHRLDESRTIRPGRFEYFDSEWLGLLLRITPYAPEPDAIDPDVTEDAGETP